MIMDPQPSPQQPMQQKLHSLLSFPILMITNKRRRLRIIITCSLCFLSLLLILIIIVAFFNKNTINPFQPDSFLGIGLLSQVPPKTPQEQPPTSSGASSSCDNYSNGRWVRDENSYAQPSSSYSEDCPFLDPGFRCRLNGRLDEEFRKWRWQPESCDLPSFNASDLLERSRNGRIVFVGDSIGRNQWESLLCMLTQGVSNQSTIYEENGNPITKHTGFLSMRFEEHNLTVEYYREPFLVILDRPPPNTAKEVRGTIRVDMLHWYSVKWVEADVLVFNSAHWWNTEKTIDMGFYFQEGVTVNQTMDVMEAFRRSLQTWKSWATHTLHPEKSFIFFRGYSPLHYKYGTWNEGGKCDTNTAPEKEYKKREADPPYNLFISDVLKDMETADRKVQFLNITYLTEFRSDGHPSNHREPGTPFDAPQDCSHWCLPGVPDTWNELLYAHLVSKGFRTKLK